MSSRLLQLESSLQFQKFVYNVEEELNWIKEREHQSSSTDLGSNLSGVQQLVKKHEVRENGPNTVDLPHVTITFLTSFRV